MPIRKIQKTKINQRRYDELAWLLENTSMCTAVSFINKKFYIAANEFFVNTAAINRNQQLNNVCCIMEFFKKIANQEFVSEKQKNSERDNLMKIILKNQTKVESKGGIKIAGKMIETIVKTKYIKKERLPNLKDEKLNKYIKKRKGIAFLILGKGIEIYKRFAKIEGSIIKALENNFEGVSAAQLEGFKCFDHDDNDRSSSHILFLPKDKGMNVHAEAQILNKIIDTMEKVTNKLPVKNFYIGISKLCCKNCCCLLEAANEVLKEDYSCSLKFKGAHNADFSANWGRPPMLIEAESMETQEKLTLKEKINIKYTEKFAKEVNKTEEDSNSSKDPYDQRHSPSSSEAEEQIIERYREKLEDQLNILKQLTPETSNRAQGLLKLGLKLCDLKRFKEIFAIKEKIDLDTFIANIMVEYEMQAHPLKLAKEALLAFLSNENYCGEIYKHFKSLENRFFTPLCCYKGKLKVTDASEAIIFSSEMTSPKIKNKI